jgi:hypothetical protein
MKKYIEKTEEMGEKITLGDHSRWKVGRFDKLKAMGWKPGDEVKVILRKEGKCEITNLSNNETVDAERIR